MKRSIALAALAALVLVPATAEARAAKVYRGSFTLVGSDGDYVTGKFGKVHLVDGKRNDKLSVHVRRVAARTTYRYRLQQGTCREGAPGGTNVAGWTYRPLRTRRSGVGNATARSRTFTAHAATRYAVVVYAGGEVVLCAQLHTKASNPKNDEKSSRGTRDEAPASAEDKVRGKSEQAPGRAEDKVRGKSQDAPGHAKEKPRR